MKANEEKREAGGLGECVADFNIFHIRDFFGGLSISIGYFFLRPTS
jgi:hypothetical protein